MVKNEIYPAVIKYIHTMAKTVNELSQAGMNNEFLKLDLNDLTVLASKMRNAVIALEKAVEHFDYCYCDTMSGAIIARDEIVNAMNELRAIVDETETKVDADAWPIPTYVDLMFGI